MSQLTRQQRINRNLRIHDKQTKLSRILSVSPIAIADTLAQSAHSRMLADLIDVTELAATGFTDKHCSKSGQFIESFTHRQLVELVNIHGLQRAATILEYNACSYVSPAWLFTDPQALSQLSRHDPIGYFCYSAGLILSPATYRATATAPQYTLESQATYEPIDKADAADMAQTGNGLTTPQLARIRLMHRITANRQLQTGVISDERIIEVNELMRRYLSLIGGNSMRWNRQLAGMTLPQITANVPAFNLFVSALSRTIGEVVAAITSRHKHQTTPDHVTYQDILEVKRKCGGMSNMMQQRAVRAASKSDAIMYDLREFIVDGSTASEFRPATMPKRIDPPKPLPIATAKPTPAAQPAQSFTGLKLGGNRSVQTGEQSAQSAQSRLAALLKGNK